MNYAQFFTVVAAYLISGAVILRCLSKLKMRVAFRAFLVLFFVFALYIPAVLGTGMFERILLPITGLPTDEAVRSFLLACAPVFTVTSVATVVFALVVGTATLILSIHVVHCVVRLLRRGARHPVSARPHTASVAEVAGARRSRRIYIEFCRLLN